MTFHPGEHTLHVVQALDAAGRPMVSESRRVRFQAKGALSLWDNRGIPDDSRVIALANGRAHIRILGPGSGTVTATLVGDEVEVIIPLE